MTLDRRELLLASGATALVSFLPGCAPKAATATVQPAQTSGDIGAVIDRIADNLLTHYPESATSLGIDKDARSGLKSKLTDRSAEGQKALADQLRSDVDALDKVDVKALDHATRTDVEVIRSSYGLGLDGFALPYGDVSVGGWRNTPYVVIQNVGAYLDIPRFLDAEHQIATADDAEAYLARLESYPDQLDGELGRMKSAADFGMIPPSFLIDKALKQMEASLAGAREGGGLVESLVRRTKEKSIAGNWDARAQEIVRKQVAPALERQIAEMKAQRPRAKMDAGMWAQPRGDDYYAWALRASTTTRMTPEEVHQTGLSELADLHGRMDPILKKLGYTNGSVGERMNALAKDPRYQFSEGDKGRAEMIAFIQEWLGKIRAQLPRAFKTMARGNVEVRRLPPEEEPGAPGAYGGAGSIDGTIPGKFWINQRSTDLHSKYSLPDLTMHEAIPGHVWQGEYAQKLRLIRSILSFNAYSEGWALYAEQLADELGLYDDYEVGRLGYLQSLAFRACRLVVDTGLHAKRWTREKGVQFFVEENGSNPQEVASEVDRYCSWPGQACGYKIGHTEINRQRTKAQSALGSKYDLRDFNDTVVLGGNVPLDVLALNVEAYIKG